MSKIKPAVRAAALIVAAAVPSTAIARPVDAVSSPSFTAVTPVLAAPAPAAHDAQGFHWDDAAFGAAGMLVLMGVGSGTVVAVRRRTRVSAATS